MAEKDATRKRLDTLQAICRAQLFSPGIHDPINSDQLRRAAFIGTNLTDKECDVMIKVINAIRPYVPRKVIDENGVYRDPEPHVALHAPFALIANQFLRAAGYSKFTRRISPEISMGSRHALPLNAAGIYEVLGSSLANQYDICDTNGAMIIDMATARKHKEEVFSSFFDLGKIRKICNDHGLTFAERQVLTLSLTWRCQLLGCLFTGPYAFFFFFHSIDSCMLTGIQ